MRSHFLLAFAVGAGVGVLSTFLVMRDANTVSPAAVAVGDSPRSAGRADEAISTDPVETSGESATAEDASDYPTKQMDMKDPIQRDICISYWYLGMNSVVNTLEIQTGHKFKPVAKLSAGPVEILEEQAAFMRDFLEETRRLGDNQ
jgi:hypothetical protein